MINEKINQQKDSSSEDDDPYVIDDFYSDSESSTPTAEKTKDEKIAMSNISTESQMTFKPTETPSAVLSEVETETL